MMPIQGGDRRWRLRHATNAAHRRLDDVIDRAGLLESGAGYARLLQATWAARRPAELALDGCGAGRVYRAWPRRRISAWLSQDVYDVSRQRPADPAGGGRDSLSDAQCLGVLYVLEGSALGAAIIGRRAAAIGMTAAFGARHLARQSEGAGAWAGFLEALRVAPLSGADEDACVAEAVATFGRYEHAFAPLLRAA